MRKPFAVATLLALALSGCASDPVPAQGEATHAVVQGEPVPTDVTFFVQDLRLVGRATLDFQATVPPNATSIQFMFTLQPGPTGNAVLSSFQVELEGCGAYTFPVGPSVGANVRAPLCDAAAPGAQAVHVSNDGFAEGNLQLFGKAVAAPSME